MVYLRSFTLPLEREGALVEARMAENGGPFGYIDNYYPCCIFDRKGPKTVSFRAVTVFYGGNGSGKSTLLNLIARKLGLIRTAPMNSGELFDSYAENCEYSLGDDDEGFPLRIPNGSRIISSDDVFDYMLAVRTGNEEKAEQIELAKFKRDLLKYGEQTVIRTYGPEKAARMLDMLKRAYPRFDKPLNLMGVEDFEEYRSQLLALRKSVSRRQFVRKTAGTEVRLESNGETALTYFESKLKNDALYCLDEPENSLSPKMQLALVSLLETKARLCGCQFIIATHSPFLLALSGAEVYDLDSAPVRTRNWWELENVKTYRDFFEKHRELFSDETPDGE